MKLTGHASHNDLSAIQINRMGHVYFLLPPSGSSVIEYNLALPVRCRIVIGSVRCFSMIQSRLLQYSKGPLRRKGHIVETLHWHV